ncbi:cellobiohydrolase A (1,4-beta-cellobiosidase A) [Rubidibacter lacunae KORDI 51-2]|uniref:Cellobiohydrolase A (1,4-beta-cellobiosidase A) n=2 Tax=Rubidibacter TaxID=582491 RepID=U5D7G8_9CHRO|nr:cellobiohydrolase A (1,4-beta-cellobiosidase A) [Rubidibacter lacunae KORDI 51-2]
MNYTVDFVVTQDWVNGFEGAIALTNTSALALEDWTLEFTADFEITSLWDARIVSRNGDRYTIEFADYNPDLSPGETITFGFIGIPGSTGITSPTDFSLNGNPLGENNAPSLFVADAEITEGDSGITYLNFLVTLDRASTDVVTVDFETVNGTALAGEDYSAQSGTLSFAVGETSKTVQVAIDGDTQVEPDETLQLRLSNASGAAIADAQGTGTITNDDTNVGSVLSSVLTGQSGQSDVFSFTWNWGSNTTIENFDPTEDTIDLRPFWFPSTNEFTIQDTGNGSVLIDIPSNNQTVTIADITADRLIIGENLLYQPDNNGGGTLPPSENSFELVGYEDAQGDALQITLDRGVSSLTLNFDGDASDLRLSTNNGAVIEATLNPLGDGTSEILLDGLDAGRASLQIENVATGEVRFVGVRIRNEDGTLPNASDYVTVGSVSEDSAADLNFWQDFGEGLANKRVDSRYIYLNGGPLNNPFNPDPSTPIGWRSWGDGNRVRSYIEESMKLGMTPTFVWYNIPDGGESYTTNLLHIQSNDYMRGYFEDLKFALDEIVTVAGDETVSTILEPDFLGYLAQNSGSLPQDISAQTSAIYELGILDSSVDPLFDNSVRGLVQAINYTISKYAPNVEFGWQFNLWASPAGGFTNVGIPGKGIVHLTETLGFEEGKQAIIDEAVAIADYYKQAGVLSYGADFISIDKYGLDGAAASAGAAADPQDSIWFWNHDLWKNYLLLVETLHAETDKPVTLWQLPVGRINGSQAENPYSPDGVFPDLLNVATQYEDSAGTFFFGDTFIVDDPERLDYFSQNRWQDTGVSVEGNVITWAPNFEDVAVAGVDNVLFGAGVGISTDGVGDPPTDGYWWISQVQEYYASLNTQLPSF